MNNKENVKPDSGEVLEFPSPGSKEATEAARSAQENAVLEALLADLRASDTRKKLLAAADAGHQAVESLLREPRLRARLAECLQAYITEQTPRAIMRFAEALENRESWAYKVLFELIGLQALIQAVPPDQDQPDVIISDAFERDFAERTLSRLRGANLPATQSEHRGE